MNAGDSQPPVDEKLSDDSSHDAKSVVVGTIEIEPPTWGEMGLIAWRLIRSGETKAVEHMSQDFKRAFACTEVLRQLMVTLTPEQRATYERVYAAEMSKQDRY